MSYVRHLLLAILSLVLLNTETAHAGQTCQHIKDQSAVMLCCVKQGRAPAQHDCCKQKSSAHFDSRSSIDGCSCGNAPIDSVPTAFSLKLLPDKPVLKAPIVQCSWHECLLAASALHYEPPNLRRPYEKIYLMKRSLLI